MNLLINSNRQSKFKQQEQPTWQQHLLMTELRLATAHCIATSFKLATGSCVVIGTHLITAPRR
jgi:hypothetical protein